MQPPGKIEFRIIKDRDDAFLRRVYAGTREWEFQHMMWSEAEKKRFVDSQFDLQDRHYRLNNLKASFRIITFDGVDIGRLIVDRSDDILRIIDFSLLPDYRGKGIGSSILQALMNEAANGRVPVRLYAIKHNVGAQRLYFRHGFQQTGVEGHHIKLEWKPGTGPAEI